ncbi:MULTISPECIES: integrase catalytic domain-containing protein [Acinetobacter]|uniref:Integrase catalytic domain-containing protein n=1 Tax=Acinetobacter higginsii TaxID=70347 RepID=N9T477_9GAMM|nr:MULTISPECIES: DDE-type integrase/transposase/recombinase [Acinetobacter]ENX58180.1 hypothetical protein F902_02580 [Acinetobacter higginsii]MCJ0829719.1 transposase family protein [Acinetobacter sp. NIPH1876]
MAAKIDTVELAQAEYLKEVKQKLETSGFGSKDEIVSEAAAFLSIGRNELYRRLKAIGYTTGRKTRSDKGKSVVDADTAKLIGGLVYEATRANGKRTTSIKGALKIAQANGVAPDVSAATIGRRMKQELCHPTMLEAPTPHQNQRSLHPNHVWELDASTCILFYLPKEGGVRDMHPSEFNKNKPENLKRIEKDMVTRYVITDHYSGNVYLEYVRGSESAQNLINIMLNAMQRRDNKNPMHGVPMIIYTDKGSAMTSGLFTNLLDRLDIQIIDHAKGNARAKGQVEKHQDIIECEFEGRIKYMKDKITTLSQLNAFASKWTAHFNETSVHSRTGKTRNAVWQTIKPEKLRIAPPIELCKELVTTKPESKTVTGNLRVKHTINGYGSYEYDVSHVWGVHVKAKFDVVVNPFRAPCIDLLGTDEHGNPMVYTIEPDQMDLIGGWNESATIIGETPRAKADSQLDKVRKEIRQKAYNVNTDEEVEKAIKQRKGAFSHIIDPMADVNQTVVPDYLPRAGEQMTTPDQRRQVAPVNLIQAAKQIRGVVGDLWTHDHYKALQKSFPTGEVPQEVIPEIIAGIQNESTKPKLRVVGE